jgi:cytosine/adenosine deaminase-related metal-dependent hydrolase
MSRAAGMCEKFNSGVHIHVAEDKYDQEHSLKVFGKRVVERLHDFGFTGSSKSLFIHGLHLDESEKAILKNSKAWIVENIESNLNNNAGFFDGRGLGERIFYGTDGMHGDMIRSAQSAFFAGRQFGNPDFETTYRNLRNVHNYLNQNKFEGDGDNNLILLDYNPPTPFDKSNFFGHFIYGLHAGFISDVIANGKFVYKNRQLTNIDKSHWLAFSREQAKRLWEKLK